MARNSFEERDALWKRRREGSRTVVDATAPLVDPTITGLMSRDNKTPPGRWASQFMPKLAGQLAGQNPGLIGPPMSLAPPTAVIPPTGPVPTTPAVAGVSKPLDSFDSIRNPYPALSTFPGQTPPQPPNPWANIFPSRSGQDASGYMRTTMSDAVNIGNRFASNPMAARKRNPYGWA